MKLHKLTPVVSSISSAESAEALTLLRSSSYGPSPEGFGPQGGAQERFFIAVKKIDEKLWEVIE